MRLGDGRCMRVQLQKRFSWLPRVRYALPQMEPPSSELFCALLLAARTVRAAEKNQAPGIGKTQNLWWWVRVGVSATGVNSESRGGRQNFRVLLHATRAPRRGQNKCSFTPKPAYLHSMASRQRRKSPGRPSSPIVKKKKYPPPEHRA